MTVGTRGAISRRGLLGAAGAAVVSPMVGACRGAGGGRSAGPERADEVRTMTGFGTTAREIFQWVAWQKGFFADANIEILSVEAGGGGDTNHTALGSGRVDFMIADSSGAFSRYADGVDQEFQVLAAIHQRFPMALLAFEDQGIFRPRDLNGRTVGIAAGTIAERLWPVYAHEAPGLDPGRVEVLPTSPQTQVQELVAGQLDAIALFSVAGPSVAAAGGGRPVTALPWADVFTDLYGAVLLTRKQLIARNPDLVHRFTGAMLRGLEYTLEHPEEAAQMMLETFPESDPEVAAEEVSQLRDFCYAGLAPNEPLGHISADRLARQLRELASLGEINEDFNLALPAGAGDGVVNFDFVPAVEDRS